MLKYDTIHGMWDADIEDGIDSLTINGRRIAVLAERDPSRLPWEALGVDLVIDATGKFNNKQGAEKHLEAGASSVIITAPGSGMDLTVVMGVNDGRYDPERHKLLSAASCTTNCVAPVLKIIDDAFTVRSGWMTTVHAYTNDQKHLDNPHADLRRARSCTQSIIPTTTGVGKALRDILPHLAPVMQGISLRVPTPDVSLADMTLQLGRSVTADEVKAVFQEAVTGEFARYVGYSEEPLVSSDYIGHSKSAVVDGLSLMASGDQVKILAWYDNEWAYASRVADLMNLVASQTQKRRECRMEQSSIIQLTSVMKEQDSRLPKLGTILCRDCGGFIDELDTNRVIVFLQQLRARELRQD